MPVIECEHLTKEYRLGQFASLKETIGNQFRRLARRPVELHEPFKALNDVSFSVEPGEVLGIIGHNGAGKSTLLKILSGITTPTTGSINVGGRIAPLIEVGAGFVPNLTGRENVYLNGSILGLSRKEIDRKFDEIVSFAEIEEFIDTPVKRYSSGMQVKLAFSVATSINAEIIIVDEVLAVGDLAFQRKCFDRMEGQIRNLNSTVLVVSHNLRQVARMCSRVLLLDHGALAADGAPQEVCNMFYSQNNRKILLQHEAGRTEELTSNESFSLLELSILDKTQEQTSSISSNHPVTIRMKFRVNQDLPKPEIVIGTHTTDFVYLTACSTLTAEGFPSLSAGEHTIECVLPKLPLKAGAYGLRVAVGGVRGSPLFVRDNVLMFDVFNPKESSSPPLRVVDVEHEWHVL